MKTRFSLRARDHLGTSAGKKLFNEKHFAESAPRYDFATRALSLGRDAAWKRKFVAELPAVSHPTCVDVACGTGDVTFLLAARYREGVFIGVDLTPEMIDIAQQRNHLPTVRFQCGEMSKLQMPDHSVDILTGSYAIRNAPDLKEALDEFHRIMKPGGTVAFLDFSKPESSFSQALQYQLLRLWGGFWGLLLHGNPEVHGYISKSLKAFPDANTLEKIFQECGFRIVNRRKYFGGMMAQYTLAA